MKNFFKEKKKENGNEWLQFKLTVKFTITLPMALVTQKNSVSVEVREHGVEVINSAQFAITLSQEEPHRSSY